MRREPAQVLDLADVRFRRRIAALHARGPRLVAELLAEVARDCLIGTYIDMLIEQYLNIDDTVLDITGGRELPPLPIWRAT